MWRSKVKLTSHTHIPLSHILKGILRQEKFLKEDYRIQLCMNHVYITMTIMPKTNNVSKPTSQWLFEQLFRSISKHIKIHNWKNLQHFQLQVYDSLTITDKDLKLLSLLISQAFPKAQEISLMLPKYKDSKRGVPELIFDIGRNVSNLKAFTLYLSGLTNEDTVTQLRKNIGDARNLEVLKLGLVQTCDRSLRYGNHQMLDLSTRIKNPEKGTTLTLVPQIKEGTKVLSMEVASKLKKLKSLTYIFTNSDGGVSDEAINQIMSNTGKRLPNLEQLSLVFSAFKKEQYTNIGIKSIFANISEYFKNLRSLSLDFSDFLKMERANNDEVMQNLAVCMNSSLKDLNSLSLNFCGWKPSAREGVNIVCWAIAQYLENLEKLALGFEDCEGVTPEAIQKLTSNHQIKHLKWLTFAFNGDRFDDLETRQAVIQLALSFKTLKQFELNVPTRLGKLTDASLIAIGIEVTPYLKDLEALTLIFPTCYKLTSVGISVLTSYIALNNKKLKSLDLTFGGNTELRDHALVDMSDKISNNMVELEELTLNISRAFLSESRYTNEGIKHLIFSLFKRQNRLRSLNLSLRGTSGVTAQGILQLGSIIKIYGKQLKFLQLEFLFSKDPQMQQVKSSLLKDLWFIPTVHIAIS